MISLLNESSCVPIEFFFTISSEIKKLNIYPCEMHMLRDRRNNIS
jgi:hypothetical protein